MSAKAVRKCPKCGGKQPDYYVELWTDHAVYFYADASGRPEKEGSLTEGEPHYVDAVCKCGHRWRLRGISQITELREAE